MIESREVEGGEVGQLSEAFGEQRSPGQRDPACFGGRRLPSARERDREARRGAWLTPAREGPARVRRSEIHAVKLA